MSSCLGTLFSHTRAAHPEFESRGSAWCPDDDSQGKPGGLRCTTTQTALNNSKRKALISWVTLTHALVLLLLPYYLERCVCPLAHSPVLHAAAEYPKQAPASRPHSTASDATAADTGLPEPPGPDPGWCWCAPNPDPCLLRFAWSVWDAGPPLPPRGPRFDGWWLGACRHQHSRAARGKCELVRVRGNNSALGCAAVHLSQRQ